MKLYLKGCPQVQILGTATPSVLGAQASSAGQNCQQASEVKIFLAEVEASLIPYVSLDTAHEGFHAPHKHCQPWPAILTEVYCISLEAHLLQRAFLVDGQEVDVGLLCWQQEAQSSVSVANVQLQQCMEVLGKRGGAVSSGAVNNQSQVPQLRVHWAALQ